MVEQGLQMLNNWPPGLKGFIIGIAANFATSFIAVLGKRSVRLIVDPEIEKRVKECYQVAAVLLVGELRKQGWSETRLAALFSIMGLRNVEEAIVRVVLDEANPLEAGVGEAFEVGVVRELETSAPSEEIKQVVDDVVVKAFLPKLYRLLAQTIKDPNSRFIEILQREGFSRVMEKLQLVLDRLESQKQLPKTTSVPWNIPYEKNPWFTGRDNIITELANALSKDSVGALMQAVSGLGGIGKTQVAVEYAYRNRDKYNAVFWVRADTTLDLSSGFLEMAKLLDLPEKDARDSNEAVSAVKRWLQGNSGWLLILDNADNPELVKEFRPLNPQGHILLTSRAQVFQILGISRPVEIDEMSPSEALEFLYKRTGREESDGAEKEATAELAKELGYLPLALEQAAAYMTAMQAPFQDYLASYLKRRLGLLAQSGPVAGDYKKSVATTWAMNFSEVAKESKAAADLLRVSAFLAPDSIPLELIKEGASQLGPTLSAAIGQAKDDRLAISEILEPLTRYSLIRRDVDAHTYSIHRMVQEVLKYGMDPDTQKLWAERAIRAVNRAFPFIEFANWPLCDRLLPQGMAAMSLIEKYGFEFQEAGRILNEAGCYLGERGRYAAAAPLYQRSLAMLEKALGPDHPDVGASLNNLAELYRVQGKYSEAGLLYKRSLAIDEKALGPEHPYVATDLNNLAELYRVQGKYAEAEPLYKRSLAIREKALGPEHPDVATSLNNLALLYRVQGRYAEAEPLYKRSLAIREKALGPEHPDVATSLNNLAGLYNSQGRYAEAEPLYKRSLAITEKALGPEHPDVAQSLENYAGLLRKMNRVTEAKIMEARARSIRAKQTEKG